VPDHHSLEALSAADFRGYVGSLFRLGLTSPENGFTASAELELAEVNGPVGVASSAFRAPFSLMFRGPLTSVLPQAIYPLNHDKLGTLELFLVPVGPEEAAEPQQASAMRYEAVFG
jgi:hypothetical protein